MTYALDSRKILDCAFAQPPEVNTSSAVFYIMRSLSTRISPRGEHFSVDLGFRARMLECNSFKNRTVGKREFATGRRYVRAAEKSKPGTGSSNLSLENLALRFALRAGSVEPLAAFRQATARSRRTKVDWAIEVAHLMDTRYVDCELVTLVSDNLNTHTKGALYEAFPADQARGYVRRLNFVHTPKHGSWLNVAECELSCLTSQCLAGRRIGELEVLQSEIKAWAERTNTKQRGIDWQFTVETARTKLKKLYPQIKL